MSRYRSGRKSLIALGNCIHHGPIIQENRKRRTEAFLAFLHGVRGSAWLNMPAINVLGVLYSYLFFLVTLPLISHLVGHMLQL